MLNVGQIMRKKEEDRVELRDQRSFKLCIRDSKVENVVRVTVYFFMSKAGFLDPDLFGST